MFGSFYSSFVYSFSKEESEKFGLKLNIQKTKIMASGPITSWQIDGKTVETMTAEAPILRSPDVKN